MAEGENQQQPAPQEQPGVVISPGATTPPQPSAAPATPYQAPVTPTQPTPQTGVYNDMANTPATEAASFQAVQQTDQYGGGFSQDSFYGGNEDTRTTDDGAASVSWTASEFISHEKNANWYVLLGLVGVIIAVGVFFLNGRDYISAAVILLGAVALGVYGARKPRQLEYRVDSRGIQIGGRYFSFHEFRSFSIVPEGAFSSIVFMPLKRFMPTISIYYAPEDEDRIVSVLAGSLPMSNQGNDAIDRLTRRLRF